MVKSTVSHTIEREILKEVEEIWRKDYPGASRSYVIEVLLRDAIKSRKLKDVSIAK